MGDPRADLIRLYQQKLADLGYVLLVDGDFGEATRRAVLTFQAQHGLEIDGKIGPKTMAALDVIMRARAHQLGAPPVTPPNVSINDPINSNDNNADCPNQRAPMERIICADKELSSLDVTMAQLYLGLLPPEGDTHRAELRNKLLRDQRLWRKSRLTECSFPPQGQLSIEETVTKRTCLVDVYHRRITQLSERGNTSTQPNMGSDGPPPTPRQTIHRECLIVFDDSFNVHSVEWDLTVTYKKLRHCYELELEGPAQIDVGGLAKEFVRGCIDKGLSDQRTRFIAQGIAALGIDILSSGATAGSSFATTLALYVDNVVDKTLECITDVEGLSQAVEGRFKDSFSAKIQRKDEWIYFKL